MATYSEILNINESLGRVNSFSKTRDELRVKNNNFLKTMEMVQKDSSIITPITNVNMAVPNTTKISNSFGKEDFNSIKQKLSIFLKAKETNANVYVFDTETIGGIESLNKLNDNMEIVNNFNNKNFVVSEFSMYKYNFNDIDSLSEYKYFTSALSKDDALKYIADISSSKIDKTSMSSLMRFSGYNITNGAVYGTREVNGQTIKSVEQFGVPDLNNLEYSAVGGAKSQAANAQYIKGTSEYKKGILDLFNTFENITNEEDAIIVGMNTENFDFEAMKKIFKETLVDGRDITDEGIDELFEKINSRSFDTQKMLNSLIRDKVTENQNIVREKYVKEREALKTEYDNANTTQDRKIILESKIAKYDEAIGEMKNDITLGNTARSMEVGGVVADMNDMTRGDTAHIAPTDTRATGQVTAFYSDDIINAGKEILDTESINNKILYFNSSVQLDDTRIFSAQQLGGNTNYNRFGIERGHGYRAKLYRLNEETGEFANKRVFELSDIYDDGKVFSILLNDGENATDLLLNTSFNILEDNKKNIASVIDSTLTVNTEKASNTLEAFTRVNSDKGYDYFNSYLEDYKIINNAIKDGKIKSKNLMDMFKNPEDLAVLKEMNISNRLVYNGEVIAPNAINFSYLYNDFNNNFDFYNDVQKTVNSTIGIDDGITINKNYNVNSKNATKHFNNITKNLENTLYESTHTNDILDFILNNENIIDQDDYSYFIKNSGGKVTPFDNMKYFKSVFGEKFSKDSELIRKMAFGYTPNLTTLKDLSTLDILTKGGEYSRLQANSVSSLQKSIGINVYRNSGSSMTSKGKLRLRENYLNDIINDFANRGLLDKDDVINLNKIDTLDAKIQKVSSTIFNKKEKISKTYKQESLLKQMVESEAILDDVSDAKFINGLHSKEVFTKPISKTFLGQSYGELYKNLDLESRNKILTLNSQNIIQDVDNINLDTFFENELGWKTEYIESFKERILKNRNLFKNDVSSKIFTDENGKSYLALTGKKNERAFSDLLGDGTDLDTLKQQAAIIELPKVSNIEGIEVIQRGNVYKVVNKDLVALTNSSQGKRLMAYDTIETFIYDLSKQLNNNNPNYAPLLESISSKDFDSSNSMINKPWRNISENKTLTGNTIVANMVDGKIEYSYKLMPNKIDRTLNNTVDPGGMLPFLNEVFADNEALKISFAEETGENAIDFVNNIKKNNIKSFKDVSTKKKIWFENNIKEIARSISRNEKISKEGVSDILAKIISVGPKGFVNSEGTEAASALINLDSMESVLPWLEYSNAGRPPIYQIGKADVLYEPSVKSLMRYNLPKDIVEKLNAGSSIEDLLGIKLGVSISKEARFSDVVNDMKLNKYEGFRAKISYMNAGQMQEVVDKTINDKKALSDLIKNIQEKYKITDLTEDAVIKELRNVLDHGALYEDSGLINRIIGESLSTTGIKELKTSRPDLITKEIIKPGDVIDIVDGRKILHEGAPVKVANRTEKGFFVETKDSKDFIKLGIGEEKFEAVMATTDDTGKKIQDVIFKKILGADIIINPSIESHKAFGTYITQYTNAIVNSITDDTEMNYVNDKLSKLGEQSYRVQKTDIGYMMVNAPFIRDSDNRFNNAIMNGEEITDELKKGYDTPKRFLDVYEDLLNDKTMKDFNERLVSSNRAIESKTGIYVDVLQMKDNTIQKVQEAAKITNRDINVFGNDVGNSSFDNPSLFFNENGDTLLRSLRDEIESKIINSKTGRASRQQGLNILNAISLTKTGEQLDPSIIVKEVVLKDVVIDKGAINAKNLPDIFKFSNENGGVNVFKVNLGRTIKTNGFGSVSSVYVPAINPNVANDLFYLPEINKAAADLFSSLTRIEEGVGNIKINNIDNILGENINKYYRALADELYSKNGVFKRGQYVNIKNSIRGKSAMILPPIYDEEGFLNFGRYNGRDKTILPDGKVIKKNFAIVNVKEAFGNPFMGDNELTGKFYEIGNQLLNEDISKDLKFLNILNEVNSTSYKIDDLEKLKELTKTNIKNNNIGIKSLATIGERYLDEVGIQGSVGRNPIIYSTSMLGETIYLNKKVGQGIIITTADIAKKLHGDSDGDEILAAFLTDDSREGFFLRNRTDETIQYVLKKQEADSASLIRSAKEIGGAKKNKINNTLEYFVKNIEYSEQNTPYNIVKNLISKNMKDMIGPISNSTNNINVAMNSYVKGITDLAEKRRVMYGVNTITAFLQQSAISVKNINTIEGALNMLFASDHLKNDIGNLFVPLGKSQFATHKNKQKIFDSLTSIRRLLDPLVESGEFGGYAASELSQEELAVRMQRILKGNPMGSTAEQINKGVLVSADEALAYVLNVSQSEEGQNVIKNFNTVRTAGNEAIENIYDEILNSVKQENLDMYDDKFTKTVLSAPEEIVDDVPFVRKNNFSIGDYVTNNPKTKKEEFNISRILSFDKVDGADDRFKVTLEDAVTNQKRYLYGDGEFFAEKALQDYDKVLKDTDALKEATKSTIKKENTRFLKNLKYNTTDELKRQLLKKKSSLEGSYIDVDKLLNISDENLENMVNIGEHLKLKGTLTNKESDSLIKGMIDRIKSGRDVPYKQALRDSILKSSLARKYSLNKSNVDAYIRDNLNVTSTSVASLKKRKLLQESFKSNTRLDEKGLMHNLNTFDTSREVLDNMDEYIKVRNMQNGSRMNKIIRTGLSSNSKAMVQETIQSLNWNSQGLKDMLSKGSLDDAADILRKTVVPGGVYAGYQFGEVGHLPDFEESISHLRGDKIYDEFFETINLRQNLINNNKDILFGQGDWSSSISNEKDLSKQMQNDLSDIRKNLNDSTKERARTDAKGNKQQKVNVEANAKETARKTKRNPKKTESSVENIKKNVKTDNKSNKKLGKSIIEKMGDISSKNKFIIPGAIAASVLGLAYLTRDTDVGETDKEKAQRMSFSNNSGGNIKESSQVNQDSNYTKNNVASMVPASTKYYNNESIGLNVSVNGSGGSNSTNMMEIISDIKGNGNVNISTTYNDNKRTITDNEISETVSNMMY